MTMALDATACEVHGDHQQGAADGYTHTLGDHRCSLLALTAARCSRARQRTGRANTARGTARFVEELAARVRRAGASGELTLRADSGFWSAKTIRACRRHQIRSWITVRLTTPIRADRHHRRTGMGRHCRSRGWHRGGRRDPLPG